MDRRKSRYDTNLGASVSVMLAEARTTQADLAETMQSSPSYFSQVMTGRKKPSPEWVELIATCLKVSKEKRRELHRAAAKDVGFKL